MNDLTIERLLELGEAAVQPRNFLIVLAAGFVMLAFSVFVLSRTRLGQARPLSKCIVLSMFAHALLFGCAYATNLFAPKPVITEEPPVVMLSLSADSESAERLTEQDQPRIWERPQQEPPPETAPVDPAPKQLVMSEPVIERGFQFDAPPPPQPAPTDALPSVELSRPLPTAPPSENLRIDRPVADAAAMEAPAPAPRMAPDADDDFPLPTLGALAQSTLPRGVSSEAMNLPGRQNAQERPDDSAMLSRLEELATKVDAAESVADVRDELAATLNRMGNRDPLGSGAPDGDLQFLERSGDPAAAEVRPRASAASAPRRLGDGAPLAEIYYSRVAGNRTDAVASRGATEQTEGAVQAALRWLAANQSPDGRWRPARFGAGREDRVAGHDRKGAGANADTGVTALALLAFLGAGNTHLEGDYRAVVRRSLQFLMGQQKANGDLGGDAKLFARMYCHGMAALALAEAYAISGDPALKRYVERAVQFSVDSQHKQQGGWRYQAGDVGDMSQFGWQVMALKSAELAGVQVPEETKRLMRLFLDSVTSGASGGLASYRPRHGASRPMTAEALVCRHFLGVGDAAARREASAYIIQQPPSGGQGNLYYWYYGTLGLFFLQDENWDRWNQALVAQLLSRQRTTGPDAGSWDADTTWAGYGGRVYTTAMAAMCLEVYYRYAP